MYVPSIANAPLTFTQTLSRKRERGHAAAL